MLNTELTTSSTSYFVDALTDEIVEDLQEKLGYSESEAYALLYSGGLSIYSTQDSSIQSIVEEEINDSANYNDLAKVSWDLARVRHNAVHGHVPQAGSGHTKGW